MLNLRYLAIVTVLVLAPGGICQSQPSGLQIFAGVQTSRISATGSDVAYTPGIFPLADIHYCVHLDGRVSFISGISFQRKGFSSRSELYSPADQELDVYTGRTRYDFLSIPLLVSVQCWQRKSLRLSVAGGMSYGFLMRAQAIWRMENYRYGRLRYSNEYLSKPLIALFPRDSRIPVGPMSNFANLSLFNPAIATSLTLHWRKRLLFRAFYEYNLYNVSSEPGTDRLRLHTAGVAAGITF